MEKINSIGYKAGLKDRLTALIKRMTILLMFATGLTLSSCTTTRDRDYGTYDRDGYYERQGDYGHDNRFRNRAERNRWEREHRRWHRLHDRNIGHYDNDDDTRAA